MTMMLALYPQKVTQETIMATAKFLLDPVICLITHFVLKREENALFWFSSFHHPNHSIL